MVREKLKATLDEAEWEWLAPHHARGALIVVSRELDLLDTGEQIVRDAKKQVEEWLKKGLLRKPTSEELALWKANPGRRFLVVIAQPWVLVQELLLH